VNPPLGDGFLLGLIQGLTEFLPISSSGHLVLGQELLGFEPTGVLFEVVLHVATLLSVVIAYRERLLALLRGALRREGASWRYLGLLLLASLPAAVVGIGFRSILERAFDSGVTLAAGFLVTALALFSTRWAKPGPSPERITPGAALLMGVAQAVAILPAVSRAGSTIVAGLWFGIGPAAAAEFSFLMSIIAVGGSGLLMLTEVPPGFDLWSAGLVTAFVTALVSGIWAIRFLVRLLRAGRVHHFAWYCAVLAVLSFAWIGFGRG
jgi:undecaprenyl-diphosphatase